MPLRQITGAPNEFDVPGLKVGDVIGLTWVRAYQHGATMRITRMTAKTIFAEEVKGSYGGPMKKGDHPVFKKMEREATSWKISKRSNFFFLPFYDDETKPWTESGGRYTRFYPEHYDWNR